MDAFDDRQLKIALAWHLVEGIVSADEAVAAGEIAYQETLFPRDVLEAEGFCDEDGVLTARLEEARQRALAELPGRLALADKLEIVTMCVDASVVDHDADLRELRALQAAVEVLHLSPLALDAHLDTLPQVGTIDLPDPVDEGA